MQLASWPRDDLDASGCQLQLASRPCALQMGWTTTTSTPAANLLLASDHDGLLLADRPRASA
jgi:hypothetical protein